MTTKLQYSLNPFRNNIHHYYYPEQEVDFSQKLEFPMDRILELQNVELMKKTMLMQEQVFKQQVQELHRVYSLQRKLMQQLEKVMVSQTKETTDTDNPKFALCLEPKTQTGQNFFGARDDDHNQINGHKSRMKTTLDLEIPDDQAAATTRSSVNPSEDRQKDSLRRSDEGEEETDVQVELTLSIGHNCTRKQQIRSEEQPVDGSSSSSSSKKTNKGEDLEARSVISSSTSSVYQENNTRPHWLFQDLSLNRT